MYPDRILSERVLIGAAAVSGLVVVVYASGLVSTSCQALGESYSGNINNFLACAVASLISLFLVERMKKKSIRRFMVLANVLLFINAAGASIEDIGSASNHCTASAAPEPLATAAKHAPR